MRVVFFDLDKTLLSENTANLWVRQMRKEKRIGLWQLMKGAFWMLQYRLGRASVDAQIEKAFTVLKGHSSQKVDAEFRPFFDKHVRPLYRPGALKALALHRSQADVVCLLTSAPQIVADLVARDLGLDEALCTRLEVGADGHYTGKVAGTLCFGEGKVKVATAYLNGLGASLEKAIFYSDSFTDVPMFKVVGTPVAVNPDFRLLSFAKKNNWAVLDWGHPHER